MLLHPQLHLVTPAVVGWASPGPTFVCILGQSATKDEMYPFCFRAPCRAEQQVQLLRSVGSQAVCPIQVYPESTYVSGLFHHVKLQDLLPSVTYYYRHAPNPEKHGNQRAALIGATNPC